MPQIASKIIIDTKRLKADVVVLEKGQTCGHCFKKIRKGAKAIKTYTRGHNYFCLKCTDIE